MATNDDLSTQLTLTTKLAAQIERMAAAADKLDASYSGQIDTVKQLATLFGQMDTSSTVQKIETLNKSLQTMQEKVKDAGKTSEKAFQKLGRQVEDTGKSFTKSFPKAVAVTVGALSGFTQGVRNVVAMGKSVTSFLTGFIDGVVNIGASIIAIPFKMFEGLIDMAAKADMGMNELAIAMEKLRKEFGAFTGPTNKAIIATSVSLKGFSDTGLSAWRVFGTLAERLEAIGELAKEMAGQFGLVRKEFEDNGGALLAYQKGLGISNEGMKAVSMKATAMGDSVGSVLKETTKFSLELGKSFQLDAKLISRDMSKAMQDVKHFAGATTKELGNASTFARKLGLELKDITGTLDAFETFDSAADNVSKLSQAFGVNVDAMDLMMAQDPASQIDLLRKSFASAGVDASKFNRQNLKLLATTTGLDEATARAAFSSKNQGVGLDQIKKKSGEAEKKTLSQADAMSRLADSIERMTKTGAAQTGSFFDMFIKGFLGGIQSSKEFRMMIMNIKRGLQEVNLQGVRLGRAFVQMFPGVKQFLGGLDDFFKPEKFKKLASGVTDVFMNWMKDLSEPGGKASFSDLMDKLQKKFFDFFDSESASGRKVVDGFKKIFRTISQVAAQGIVWLSEKLKDGIGLVTDLISGRVDLTGAKGAGKNGLGFMGELLVPLVTALKTAWKTVKPALFSLLDTLGTKALEWAKANESTFIKIGAVIMGYVFAMSLVRSTTALLADLVVNAAAGMLTSAASGILKKIGGDVMSNMFASAETNGISKSITDTLTKSFSKVSVGGADVGGSIGNSAISTMTSKSGTFADAFAKKVGASEVGSKMGLVAGIAIAAYIAVEGKKAIDAAFADAKAGSADLFAATVKARNVASASRIGNDQGNLEALKKQLKESQDLLDKNPLKFPDFDITDPFAQARAVINNQNRAVERQNAKEAISEIKDQIAKKEALMSASEKAAAASAEANRKTSGSATNSFVGAATLDEAKEKLNTIEDISKKLKGKDYDIKGMVESIKEKFKDVSFDLGLNLESLGLGGKQLSSLDEFAIGANQTIADLKKVPAMGAKSIGGALMAVSEMVKQANALNDALGQNNTIDIKAKLERVASALSLGGQTSYTVNPSKNVQLTVNLTVEMNAADMEKAIIMRESSVIKKRLDFATYDNPGKKSTQNTEQAARSGTPLVVDNAFK